MSTAHHKRIHAVIGWRVVRSSTLITPIRVPRNQNARPSWTRRWCISQVTSPRSGQWPAYFVQRVLFDTQLEPAGYYRAGRRSSSWGQWCHRRVAHDCSSRRRPTRSPSARADSCYETLSEDWSCVNSAWQRGFRHLLVPCSLVLPPREHSNGLTPGA